MLCKNRYTKFQNFFEILESKNLNFIFVFNRYSSIYYNNKLKKRKKETKKIKNKNDFLQVQKISEIKI